MKFKIGDKVRLSESAIELFWGNVMLSKEELMEERNNEGFIRHIEENHYFVQWKGLGFDYNNPQYEPCYKECDLQLVYANNSWSEEKL